jgi:hypothetical protein
MITRTGVISCIIALFMILFKGITILMEKDLFRDKNLLFAKESIKNPFS